jgi:hypothetical protein
LHGSDTNSTYFDTLEGRMVIHFGKAWNATVEAFARLRFCAAYFGSFWLLFRTDRLSRNFGKRLSTYAALHPRRAKASNTYLSSSVKVVFV